MYSRLIDTTFIKDNTTVDGNVESAFLEKFIDKTQDKHIAPLLGTKLYKKIMADYAAQTLSGVYLELYEDYILNVMKAAFMWEAMPELHFFITNKGIVTKDSNYSDSATEKNMQTIRQVYDSDMAYYKNRLSGFLFDNDNVLPELTEDNKSQLKPTDNNLFLGVYIRKNRCNRFRF